MSTVQDKLASCSKPEYATVGGKYKILLEIGSGSYGRVYLAINPKNNAKFAVKMDRRDCEDSSLMKENCIYRMMKKGPGIPRIHWCGIENQRTFLVMDLLGLSLSDLFERFSRQLSLKTVLMLADQLIDRLEFIHSKCLIHRDIKPSNFLIGTGKNQHIIHLVDFGLSERYRDVRSKHYPNEVRNRVGTPVFASTNVHARNTASRRDDLESLAYMLILFLRGSLPWQNIAAKHAAQTWDKVAELKAALPIDKLCEGCPVEFHIFLSYSRQLDYDNKPNYKSLKKMFKKLAEANNIEYDFVFDWTKTDDDGSGKTSKVKCKTTSENPIEE